MYNVFFFLKKKKNSINICIYNYDYFYILLSMLFNVYYK